MDGIFDFEQVRQLLLGSIVAGGAMGLVWRVVSKIQSIWEWIKRKSTYSIKMENGSWYFRAVSHWLSKDDPLKRRHLFIEYYRDTNGPEYKFESGYKFFFFKRRPVLLVKGRDRLENAMNAEDDIFYESYTFYTLFGHRFLDKLIRKIGDEYAEHQLSKQNRRILFCSGGEESFETNAREYDTNKLVGKSVKQLMEIIERDRYSTFLLEGPPGNGKTASVAAVASKIKADLWIMDAKKASDYFFFRTYTRMDAGDILVIEEIDAVAPTVLEREDVANESPFYKSGISLGAFLQAFDGLFTRNDITVFCTTNHPEKLDKAFLRPGRIDYRIHFNGPTSDDVRRMFEFEGLEVPIGFSPNSFAEAEERIRDLKFGL